MPNPWFDDPEDHPGEIFNEDLMEWLPEDRTARYKRLKELREQYREWGDEYWWAAETCWQMLREMKDDDAQALMRWRLSVGVK